MDIRVPERGALPVPHPVPGHQTSTCRGSGLSFVVRPRLKYGPPIYELPGSVSTCVKKSGFISTSEL